jgi:hypothetical protein
MSRYIDRSNFCNYCRNKDSKECEICCEGESFKGVLIEKKHIIDMSVKSGGWMANPNPVLGVESIRQELKDKYPGYKFRVRCRRHGIGKSRSDIEVEGPDGVDHAEVEKLLDRYQAHDGYSYDEVCRDDLSFIEENGGALKVYYSHD